MKHSFLFLSLIVAQAHAQIIHTDVIPDPVFSVSGDTCHLDLDNDGIADYLIRFYRSSGSCAGGCVLPGARPSWVKIDPLFSNEVAGTIAYVAGQLDTLELIDTAWTWSNTSDQIMRQITSTYCIPGGCAPTGANGQWNQYSGAARYLGLRFDIGGSTHYGWARLGLWAYINSFTLMDYAYNTVPDEFILAGDTGSVISTGVAEFAQRSAVVSPNPFTSELSVSIGSQNSAAITCTVHSITGEELVTRTIAGSHARTSFTLDLGALAPGVYLLEVVIDGERIVRKVMKE